MRHCGSRIGGGGRFSVCGLLAIGLLVVAAATPAASANDSRAPKANDDRAAEIRFLSALDLDGGAHRIGNGEGYDAVALVFMTSECPISRQYVPELNRLAESLDDSRVKFLGVVYEPQLNRAAAVKFRDTFNVAFPLLFDASGELAATLGPTHVPEAFVLDRHAQVVYQGRIDNRYGELGKRRPEATTHDLADAIDSVLNGKPIEVAKTKAVGCPIELEHEQTNGDAVTYTRDIAPILAANCVECHRPGEVAPFSLLTYEDAAKRAGFLSEVTQSRLMPPWKAEIGHGRFLGERRLSETQIALFDAWAKAGAPEGDPDDLPPQPEFASGWHLGEPGLELVAAEPFSVPAGGEDIFQHHVIPTNLTEDKTIVGFEFRPGNPSVVHHAILFLDTSGNGRRKDAETPEPGYTTFGSIGVPTAGIIGVWTPGLTPRFFPQGAGMHIPKGADIILQLHIHPSGKPETDQSSIALYFADKPVERMMSRSPFVLGSLIIDVPPGSADTTVTSSITLPTDVTLISLLPHMHLIGKEMKITATLPDGAEESLLWIKDWNFYWQDNYVYHEPVRLPAGTKLEMISRYDNSADNPLNPSDPPRRVLFGNGSTDEMSFGIFQIILDDPAGNRPLRMSLLTSMLQQWNSAQLDDEARKHIIEEAAQLFGGSADRLRRLLDG